MWGVTLTPVNSDGGEDILDIHGKINLNGVLGLHIQNNVVESTLSSGKYHMNSLYWKILVAVVHTDK